MSAHADKTQENVAPVDKQESQSVSTGASHVQKSGESTFQFADNRPQASTQRKLQEMANNSPRGNRISQLQAMAQKKGNGEQGNRDSSLQTGKNLAQLQSTTIQRVLTVDDQVGLRALTGKFFEAVESSGGVPGEILAFAKGKDNFTLKIEAHPQIDREDEVRGLTVIWLTSPELGEWKKVQDMKASDWPKLGRGARATINLTIRYNPNSPANRPEELYTLVHELGAHATKFWPMVKRVVNGEELAPIAREAFEDGGDLHQHTHHEGIAKENDGDFQKLFNDTYRIVYHQSQEDAQGMADAHITDIITQLLLPAHELPDSVAAQIASLNISMHSVGDAAPLQQPIAARHLVNDIQNVRGDLASLIAKLREIYLERHGVYMASDPKSPFLASALEKINQRHRGYQRLLAQMQAAQPRFQQIADRASGDRTFTGDGASIGNKDL